MTNKNMTKYPTPKIIIAYALFTGLLSGLLSLPFVSLFMTSRNDWGYLAIYFYWWFLVSLVPALLSGIVIGYFKIIIKRPFDYLKPFGVAFLVFFILGLVFIGVLALMEIDSRLLKFESAIYFIMLIFCIALISGVSSTILAKFILPKY
ncbi:MAG: hypothetical protein Q4B79_01210 [Moraxella sp.]|uniref:hypothetical protein n=1 Tax=Moraxella sp. TaxID=479 RepID=UPI0026DC6006|nr:hypothetical protein [Moraxella sp.]MDO4449564.1 hypothetical protein [Moraxella sp.]